MKKKGWIILGIVVVLLLGTYGFVKKNYNELVARNEGVTAAWSNVESQYQRRADLIPNLVNTVKGYAVHEQKTLTDVIEARSKATSVTVDLNDLDDDAIKKFNAAQSQLSSALSRLLAVGENYPDLKANANFMDLQAQLEGTENRIATERRKYNEVAQQYNTYLKMFPRNIIANWFDFDSVTYFSADQGSEKAPQVAF